jgi:cyclase
VRKRLPRIIPLLLYQNGGLVKTVNFKNPTYIGDPINAVKIYNEMEADELIIVDIDATAKQKPVNFELIKEVANEAFMPVCYGGGIKDMETISKIINIGIEKVSVSSAAFINMQLIEAAANKFGSQSVVVCLDVKKETNEQYAIYTMNGTQRQALDLESALSQLSNAGAGEIVINDINREGTYSGFDINMLKQCRKHTTVPIVASGGAGNLHHIKEAVQEANIDAVAAGSLFVYYGRLRGILINYPHRTKIKEVFANDVL